MNQIKEFRKQRLKISKEDFSFYFDIPQEKLEALENSDNFLEISCIKDLLYEKWERLGCEKFKYETKMQYIEDLQRWEMDVLLSALTGNKTRQAKLIDIRLKNSNFTAEEIVKGIIT